MRSTVHRSASSGLEWIDIVGPTREELEELGREFDLHPTSIQDCLEPAHLPKYEQIGETHFLIVRAHDEKASGRAESLRAITRKLAIFVTARAVITVHRVDQEYIARVRQRAASQTALTSEWVVATLLREAVLSYERPIQQVEEQSESLETTLLSRRSDLRVVREIYSLKRKLSVMKRMLRDTFEMVHRTELLAGAHSPLRQDIEETASRLHFDADELMEEIDSLMEIHFSMASHRTNEIIRVLTVFSVFFMPLTFIVGIYGMNFQQMPELRHPYGYPAVLALMALITLVIFLWFRRRGMLR